MFCPVFSFVKYLAKCFHGGLSSAVVRTWHHVCVSVRDFINACELERTLHDPFTMYFTMIQHRDMRSKLVESKEHI